jgi:hypothetical protein
VSNARFPAPAQDASPLHVLTQEPLPDITMATLASGGVHLR